MRKIAINLETQKRNASRSLPVIHINKDINKIKWCCHYENCIVPFFSKFPVAECGNFEIILLFFIQTNSVFLSLSFEAVIKLYKSCSRLSLNITVKNLIKQKLTFEKKICYARCCVLLYHILGDIFPSFLASCIMN